MGGSTEAAGAGRRRTRRLKLTLAALLLALLVVPLSGPAAPPTWQAPVTLSSDARLPSIHVDAAGTVTVFTRTGPFPNWQHATWAHRAGGQWPATATPLGPAGIGEAVYAGNAAGAAVFVWLNGSLLQASYRPAAGAWGPTETVADTGGPYSDIELALDDAGNVAVTWYRNTSTSTALVEVALRSVAASQWLPVDTMPPGPREVELQPDVAFEGNGDVVLVWTSLSAIPSFARLLTSSRSLAGTWSAPVELSPSGTSAQDVSLSSNGAGTVAATWHDVSTVRAAVRTGGVWGPSEVLALPGGTGSLADIGRAAVDTAGNVAALWSRHDGADWRVETASRPAGGSWQLPATTLATGVNGSAQPVLAGNGSGDLAATWRQSDGANVRIAAALRPAGGSWPGSPLLVSTPGADAESARVAVDSTGLAAAVWVEGGFIGVAKAAFSDGAPPTVTVTTPPDGATYAPGEAVPADYACTDDPGQLSSCSGPVPDGAPIDTSVVGPESFAVTGTDRAGNTATTTHSYSVAAAPLVISSVTEVADSVPRYGRFEAALELSRSFSNPFDPEQIAVDVTFTSPSGRVQVVPAFWYQRFTGNGPARHDYASDGAPGWRVRFAPDEVGTYAYSVSAVAGSQAAAPVGGSFQAASSTRQGFVRVDARNERYLRFDSGTPYLPVGHNVAFEDGSPQLNGAAYYDSVFGSLEAAGENWTRVWMTDFNGSALEWGNGHWTNLYDGAGTYALQSAWRLDRILELAEQHGLEVQVVLNDHGQFSTWVNERWGVRCPESDVPPCERGDPGFDPGNAYSAFNGGPVPDASPQAFFTDPDARRLFKQRLRYVVARYGAYTSMLAWELFNEVQFVGTSSVNPGSDAQLRDEVVAWHDEMSSYLSSLDPYDHLVTTSSWEPATPGLWSLPGIDLVQVHTYAAPPSAKTAELRDLVAQLKTTYGKPVVVGEVGLGSGDPDADFDPATFAGSVADREHLVEGTHLHNAIWTAALSESMAGYWWWGRYVAADAAKHRVAPTFPLNQHHVPALRAFLAGEDWAPLGLDGAAIDTTGPIVAVGLSRQDEAFVWVRDAQNEYGTGARPGDLAGRQVSGASLTVGGLDDGPYEVAVYDTWGAGGRAGTAWAHASGGVLTVPLPPFTRDVALKIDLLADADGDALPDVWETDGIDADGNGTVDLALDAPPFDADPDHKDVYVEVDYMAGHAPQPGTLADVVAAFDAAPVSNPDGTSGVRLHALLGETVPTIAPALFQSRGPGAADDFDDLKLGGAAACDGFFGTAADRAGANCAAVLAARKLALHYAIFGHSYAEAPTSSGIAELPGNDLMVTLGGKSPDWIAAAGSLRAAESGTFMHELGHNFRLRHGGFENVNCKPNYQSVMSYPLQVPYIDPDRPLDYSGEVLPSLDEGELDEGFGLGGASGNVVFGVGGQAVVAPADGAIDWDDDGLFDSFVQADVNWIETRPDGQPLPGCGESPFGVLDGHDDWSALGFDFRATADFGDGARATPAQLVSTELTSEIALETARNVDADRDGVPNAADQPIVFASARTGRGDIYRIDASGAAPTRLTTGDAVESDPAWSPDHSRIAFTSTQQGNAEIYVMNADGSNLTRLTNSPRDDTSPAWSPDGSRIAFASDRTQGNTEIYVMAANGSAVTRLTNAAGTDTAPAWSPDGTKIAFSSTRTAGGDIYVMNANGTGPVRLTTAPGVDTEPSWAGTTIAFSSNRDGTPNFEIYTMAQNGTAQTRRTNQAGADVTPVWSPDGSRLAFATNRHGTPNLELYTMNADGTAQTRRTTTPGDDAFPDW